MSNRLKLKKKRVKPVHYDQWIEAYTDENGKTVTEFYPSNEEFEKHRQERELDRPDNDPRPTYIYRRLFFRGQVPLEYEWIEQDEQFHQYGGHYLERMSVEDWLKVMGKEKQKNTGHAQPCTTPLRRPEAYGPCTCLKCQQNPDRLPELAA